MTKYYISIIIPVYNVEEYISTAMNSLLRQTIGFNNLEIIFVDDFSSDNSGEIIDQYANQYTNVLALHLETNSGSAGIPRNEGLRLATADYIMFLDPNDYYSDDACQLLYELIKKGNYDLVSGYYSIVDEAGKIKCDKTEHYGLFKEGAIDMHSQYERALELQNAFWCKIYKKNIILDNKIEFPPHIPGQDTVFLCKYLLCCNTIYYVDHKVAFYRLREKENKSISNRCDINFFKGIETCYSLVYKVMMENNKAEFFKFVIAGALEYYILKALDSESLKAQDIDMFLRDWRWIFEYYEKKNIEIVSPYAKILHKLVISKDSHYIIDIYNELRKLRKEYLKIIEGRDYLADQENKKDKAIEELKGWIKQLEEAKAYYIGQIANLERALDQAVTKK